MEAERRPRSATRSHQKKQTPRMKRAENRAEGSSPSLSEKRRKMPEEPGVSETTENVEKAREGKKETKRRRSSFVRGRSRKSIGTTNTDVTEIHTRVPVGQPPEERLRLLKLACFEYTINKLHEEFPILETMDDFRGNARAEFEKSLQELVDDGTLKAACYSASGNENPVNLEMETEVAQLDRTIRKFEEESSQWEEMRTSFTQRAVEAERSESTVMPTKERVTLSVARLKLISELPDLDSITAWAGESQEKIALQVKAMCDASRQVQKMSSSVGDFLARETCHLAMESDRGYSDVKDPRELLQKSLK